MKPFIERDVAHAQFKGCVFIQIGATAIGVHGLRGDGSFGLELLTPFRWFALRPFRRLTWRRAGR